MDAGALRNAARLYATGGNAAIYYGLGVTEHAQGSTAVIAIANLAMATGNIGREGVGVNPLRGRTTCRAPATWARSRTSSPATATSPTTRRGRSSSACGARRSAGRRGPDPHMMDEAIDGAFKGLYLQGEDIAQSDPDTKHITAGSGPWSASSSRTFSSTSSARYAQSFCPARRSSRRTAPSPTQSGASAGCARRSSRSPARPTGRPRSHSPRPWASPCPTATRARPWTRSRRRPRRSGASPTRGSTSSARSNGLATTRPRPGRRSCTSTASFAARDSSC